MIKLRDLLTEGDTIVKNKKTGNVYSVKTFNPAMHDKPTAADIQTAKAKNGGQLPKGEQPSKPTQQPQQQKPQGQKLGGNDFKSSAETGNYTFTPKDAEKKYKSAAISMVIPKLNPKDIPNIQKQLSKMDVDADFNVEKDGVRVWTRSGDYSNVGDVLKSKGLKRKQTMPTDADYQKWDDKLRASSGIKPTGGDKKPDASLNGTSALNKSKPEDLVPTVTNHLNKVSGGEGYAQKDEGGSIAYNMGDGDMPTYTLYMGKEGSKHRITLEPTYGNDPKKLQGKIDKSFDKAEDAIKFMGDVAKKHRRELEMDDAQKSTPVKGGGDKKPTFGPGGTEPSWGNKTKDDFYNAGETLRQMGWTPDDIAKRISANLPGIDDEKDIPQIKDSDDKEDWINLYKKSIAMKKAGYSSSEIADKLRANL